jgi:hypothetical protein
MAEDAFAATRGFDESEPAAVVPVSDSAFEAHVWRSSFAGRENQNTSATLSAALEGFTSILRNQLIRDIRRKTQRRTAPGVRSDAPPDQSLPNLSVGKLRSLKAP